MAGNKAGDLEYWHDKPSDTPGWQKGVKPSKKSTHIPGVVHETSTLYMSDNVETDKHASVGPDYKIKGCENVYITGGALFPSSGSWNRKLFLPYILDTL
jgi:choline dehydrogenase-like flavoprotein